MLNNKYKAAGTIIAKAQEFLFLWQRSKSTKDYATRFNSLAIHVLRLMSSSQGRTENLS